VTIIEIYQVIMTRQINREIVGGVRDTEGEFRNGQSREADHTRRRKTKQKHNTICV
jgi:hypothetical protein